VAGYWECYRRATSADRTERTSVDEYQWAFDEVDETLRFQPSAAIALLVELAEGAPDDQALAYLGAGPVEDFLLERHADDVIDQVEVAARRSAGFRSALHCAHYDDVVAPDARDRLRRFGDPY
jgi:hypothetical protein